MAEAVLSPFAQNLLTLLNEERKLLGGLDEEVKLMKDNLDQMREHLERKADANQENDPWTNILKQGCDDIQDIIDQYQVLLPRRPLPGCAGSMQRPLDYAKNVRARHRLASKLQSVKARIKASTESRQILYDSQVTRRAGEDYGNDDAFLVEENQLVGMEKRKHHLISQLLSDSGQFAVAVLGMKGIGKTTLARKVYEDGAVKSHFKIRAWVTVSQKYVIEDVLKKLIRQVAGQLEEQIPAEMDTMESPELKNFVKGFLLRGRYAIVFHDVWDKEFWDAIRHLLPHNESRGNRLMFTTSNAGVAKASAAESNLYVYEMQTLNPEESWDLFCKKMGSAEPCPAEVKGVAESIVSKCSGLPLGILAIGGLLASKDLRSKTDWERVRDGLGDDEFHGAPENMSQLERIFSLSYNDLPPNLRNCLLCTSLFPHGQDIKAQFLVHLLVAEEHVKPSGEQTAEDKAWDCLKQLANRCLIQPDQVRTTGIFRCINVRMNGLLRKFIASQKNTTVLTSSPQDTGDNVVRRLAFSHTMPRIPRIEKHEYFKKCWTIINFGIKESPSKATLAQLLSSEVLKVVDLRGMGLGEIPREVFKMSHLKIFCIGGEMITKVPKSIQNLKNLQVLFLVGTSLKELPVEIRELHKLRHLELSRHDHIAVKAPRGMGKLAELQTLETIDAAGMMSEIELLTKLRKLHIKNVRREDGKELCSSLSKLKSLEELNVASSVPFNLEHSIDSSSLQSLWTLTLIGCLEKIPPWIKDCQGLEEITLDRSYLKEDPLETLQHLPKLLSIRLVSEAYQGEILCFKAGHFLKLKRLALVNMEGLREVRIEEGAMPAISLLWMEDLPSLEDLPVGIHHLKQLQKLELRTVNSQLIKKLDGEEVSADYERISHVPQVIITSKSNIDGQWESESRPLSRKKKIEVMDENHVSWDFQDMEENPMSWVKDFQATETQGWDFSTILVFAFAILCAVQAIVLHFAGFSIPPLIIRPVVVFFLVYAVFAL